MGYISLPSIFNVIVGITSYYGVILKIVILHDEIKTIQNVFFSVIIKKRTKNLVSFFKNPFCSRQTQKPVVFLKKNKRVFHNPGGWSICSSTCTVYGLPRRDCSFYPCFQSPCHTFHISSGNSGGRRLRRCSRQI